MKTGALYFLGVLHLLYVVALFLLTKSILHEIYIAVVWMTGWLLIAAGAICGNLSGILEFNRQVEGKEDRRYGRHHGAQPN